MAVAPSVISARNVWKLFGPSPETYLQGMLADGEEQGLKAPAKQTARRTYADIRADGYIVGVGDVSLDVHAGEILVVMGLSGSGKSTLVRCMSRLHDITGGRIEIEGQDIMTLDARGLIDLRRRKMGMVFQSFGLLPHRTVLENVAFPLEMRGQNRQVRRKRALEVIELVGLSGREEYFPRELSGGQQQRVGIARSLAIEPDIWFLDEPFSALDPLIRREMQDEFLRLQSMLGKTIIFITHDFDEALRLADRIAIMKEGGIEQCDTPAQIVLQPSTEYVAKFTETVDKARVVRAGNLMHPIAGESTDGPAIEAGATLHSIARMLVSDARALIPVQGANGQIAGFMPREAALDVLFGGACANVLPRH